jgi:hypothetical protein
MPAPREESTGLTMQLLKESHRLLHNRYQNFESSYTFRPSQKATGDIISIEKTCRLSVSYGPTRINHGFIVGVGSGSSGSDGVGVGDGDGTGRIVGVGIGLAPTLADPLSFEIVVARMPDNKTGATAILRIVFLNIKPPGINSLKWPVRDVFFISNIWKQT